MSKNIVIVFMRNPELGKVKTRLAQETGKDAALKIYKYLLSHTEKILRNTECDVAVFYSEKIIQKDFWNDQNYQKYTQRGNDLGEKMKHAFEQMFLKNYDKVVIIGSDLYHLREDHIHHAFQQLKTKDVVIGPAKDGGYYLLGMKKMHSLLFQNKIWSSSSVFTETLNDLENYAVSILEELNDIDTYEDMKNITELKQLIENE